MHPILVNNLKSCAHAILPQRLWQHLIKMYLQWEVASAGSIEIFAATPLSLADFEPAYGPQTFAGGPIILVNNALAAGGVERQIVNALRGLKSRSDCSLGLLCLYLGNEPGSEFFKPALTSIPDFVRNAMGGTAATRVLGQIFPKSTRKRIALLMTRRLGCRFSTYSSSPQNSREYRTLCSRRPQPASRSSLLGAEQRTKPSNRE
jgi:hypothetical protein